MLSALDNGVIRAPQGGKWFSLIDKVMAPATLKVAWQKCRPTKARRAWTG